MSIIPRVSFEFFPPKDIEASFRLWDTVQMLAPFQPGFVSVTYGAGGGTRALTHQAVTAIGRKAGLNVAAHLTCVAAPLEETLDIARAYHAAGVRDIVALRGDPPKGKSGFSPSNGGFASSVELIKALAQTGDFNLRVAVYPEVHPDSQGAARDLDWLKAKIDAGATSAITQFFFKADTFLRFRDRVLAAGIYFPIIPGIFPV